VIALRFTVPVVAAGLLLVGCGSSDETTAEPATTVVESAADDAPTSPAKPKGSKVVADKANGYQVALPAGYLRITSKSDLNEVLKAGTSAVAKAGVSRAMVNKSLKLIAITADGTNTINVVVASAGGMTPDQLPLAKPALKEEMAKLDAEHFAVKAATIAGGPALRVTYLLPIDGRKVATTQYITVHDDKAYTLTFSQSGARLSSKIEKQTTGSWRFR
jgi:hypothetical protein